MVTIGEARPYESVRLSCSPALAFLDELRLTRILMPTTHWDASAPYEALALADDADRMARFQREAQMLASLNHPNIASITGWMNRTPVRW